MTFHLDIMPKRCRATDGRSRRSTKRQKGGILPLAALIPALVAGGKAVALGAASGAASYGAKKALEAATRKRSNPKRKIPRRAAKQKKRTQQGGAAFRRKPRLVDKIAEGMSMFLSGPSPSFAGVGLKLASQAAKGIKDNVTYYRRRGRR